MYKYLTQKRIVKKCFKSKKLIKQYRRERSDTKSRREKN